ncbi:hypothetical protein [Streptomyces roseoverticillatus]|uniref:hypothetical protein n=1 Tax=Streptomyces roseoverticillatus TaxID=66429 RepID=UPI000694B69A|nr:hypothetical protein [Streptomyces roseoverticillatus]
MDDKGESEAKTKNKRLDLSLAQVAGSALAAVVAALLAGKLGVYGTVIGAGVVSVVATSGGTIFQHLFKRTGEQLREATAQSAKPKMRQVPVRDAGRAVSRAASAAAAQGTGPAGRGAADDDATRALPQADATQLLPAADGDAATRLVHTVRQTPEPGGAYAGAHPGARADEHPFAYGDAHADAHTGPYTDPYTPATTHGTRVRGWKRPLIAAGAVFVLAMGTVTAVELVKGSSADGGGSTTVGQIFDGGKSRKKQDPAPERNPGPGRSHDGDSSERHRTGGDTGSTPDPDASREGGGDTGKQSPEPSTSPSSGGSTPSTKPDPSPNPSTSPDGGTGGDGKGGSTSGAGTTGGQTTPKPPAQGQNAAAGPASAGTVS